MPSQSLSSPSQVSADGSSSTEPSRSLSNPSQTSGPGRTRASASSRSPPHSLKPSPSWSSKADEPRNGPKTTAPIAASPEPGPAPEGPLIDAHQFRTARIGWAAWLTRPTPFPARSDSSIRFAAPSGSATKSACIPIAFASRSRQRSSRAGRRARVGRTAVEADGRAAGPRHRHPVDRRSGRSQHLARAVAGRAAGDPDPLGRRCRVDREVAQRGRLGQFDVHARGPSAAEPRRGRVRRDRDPLHGRPAGQAQRDAAADAVDRGVFDRIPLRGRGGAPFAGRAPGHEHAVARAVPAGILPEGVAQHAVDRQPRQPVAVALAGQPQFAHPVRREAEVGEGRGADIGQGQAGLVPLVGAAGRAGTGVADRQVGERHAAHAGERERREVRPAGLRAVDARSASRRSGRRSPRGRSAGPARSGRGTSPRRPAPGRPAPRRQARPAAGRSRPRRAGTSRTTSAAARGAGPCRVRCSPRRRPARARRPTRSRARRRRPTTSGGRRTSSCRRSRPRPRCRRRGSRGPRNRRPPRPRRRPRRRCWP